MPFLDTLLDHVTRLSEELQRTLTPPEPVATQQQSLTALEQFIQNYYIGNNLSAQQANQNLLHGIVELTYFGQHTSQGLCITENGYILTPKHCVQDLITGNRHPNIGIHLPNNPSLLSYTIQEIWSDKQFDIAIIKAGIPGEAKPCQYKFIHPEQIQRGLDVGTLGYWNNQFKISSGIITQKEVNVIEKDCGNMMKNHIGIQIPNNLILGPGDSGSTILTTQGELIGFLSAGKGDYISAVNLQNALELVSYYIQYKRSQLRGLEK